MQAHSPHERKNAAEVFGDEGMDRKAISKLADSWEKKPRKAILEISRANNVSEARAIADTLDEDPAPYRSQR